MRSNLAVRIAEASRCPEALDTAQEAVDLRRELADIAPEAYGADLRKTGSLVRWLDSGGPIGLRSGVIEAGYRRPPPVLEVC